MSWTCRPTGILRVFPSPFPPENRLILYAEDVCAGQREMREDPSMKSRIEDHIIRLCQATDRNTMVFFRSYEMVRQMRPRIEEQVDRQLYWEESGSSRRTASSIQAFKKGRDAVFFTVMGGKVAEGLDFPGQELDVAIVVGLPYPPPSLLLDELKQRYDRKYGPGSRMGICLGGAGGPQGPAGRGPPDPHRNGPGGGGHPRFAHIEIQGAAGRPAVRRPGQGPGRIPGLEQAVLSASSRPILRLCLWPSMKRTRSTTPTRVRRTFLLSRSVSQLPSFLHSVRM